jgi:uncharacterized protein
MSGADKSDLPRRVPLARRIAMFPIRVYIATLSWLMGGQCRFTPSCSRYGLEAIEKHGALKGWGLAVWRVCRCHPFCNGGYDPVPPTREELQREAASRESPDTTDVVRAKD